MGQGGREILKLDVGALIETLNRALAEEWQAYYQYWIGARVMEGPMRSDIEKELLLHADQELSHAVMLVERIDQLDGTPVLSPDDWSKLSECPYEPASERYIETVLQQVLRGERCAIRRYHGLADLTDGKDHQTYKLVTTILEQELEHETELENWLTDIEIIKRDLARLRA